MAAALFVAVFLTAVARPALSGDPFAFYDWNVHYKTVSPLGVAQQVIAINDEFPGPIVNVTTNWNVVVNVLNSLDEPVLFTWDGVQQRRNSWQDGVLGTNCPIPAGWNWTYQFQVKDQIGSFFYFPSINFQRAAGGYGGIIINNRDVILVPFNTPHGDITLFIGDWYNRNHTDLRKKLDDGKGLGMPNGVLMNGKGPYRYNKSVVPAGIDYETINVDPGKTYRLRVHNIGIKTCLNFRIQSHNLLLVETEGTYTVAQNYTDLDICVGQSYSFLVTADQNASSDYYIVASARFVNETVWTRVTGVAILHYSNSKGKAKGPLPDPPQDFYDKTFSMNQARSIRTNHSPCKMPSRFIIKSMPSRFIIKSRSMPSRFIIKSRSMPSRFIIKSRPPQLIYNRKEKIAIMAQELHVEKDDSDLTNGASPVSPKVVMPKVGQPNPTTPESNGKLAGEIGIISVVFFAACAIVGFMLYLLWKRMEAKRLEAANQSRQQNL